MALAEYKKKRSFSKTPEPTGGKSKGGGLRFVIQKHDATRLHYDFRLEMKGVLKSWAVPKGPSLNPADKRLAMLVEDHPYDYKDFEGIIPKGNYGAGTVIIWDEGTYEPLVDVGPDKATQEKALLRDFNAGSVKIIMHGTKLQGEFALVKMHGRGENAWLLIKHRDKFAKESDVTNKDKSVISGKTIHQMEKSQDAETWQSNRKSNGTLKDESEVATKKVAKAKSTPTKTAAKKAAPKKSAVKKAVTTSKKASKKKDQQSGLSAPKKVNVSTKNIAASVKSAGKKKMPSDLLPMLATLVDKPVSEDGWLYEIKWDGYRSIAYLNNGKVELRSRNNKSFNEKFYPLYDVFREWDMNAIIDGEIVVLNAEGTADFSALQGWRSEADGDLVFYAFDLLWLEGKDLTELPLEERRQLLGKIIPAEGVVRLSENFNATGEEFFKLANDMGLEGIIAKKADSTYKPDLRSKEWLKIKTEKQQEVIIGGYTKNENTSKLFSALILGVYEGKEFRFVGVVGTGFTDKLQEEILAKLKPFQTKQCPFAVEPDVRKPSRFRPNPPKSDIVWVKPALVAEITYRELTDDAIRHPSFKGLREDKKPSQVKWERETPVQKIVEKKKPTAMAKKLIKTPAKAARKTLLNPNEETQTRSINGHELKFTNLSKLYWPKDGITKRDMLNYYYQVAPYMLPYLKDRPQSLNRYPNGINGPSFYQKDVTGKVPDWVELFPYRSEDEDRDKNFLVCSNEASLLYMASLGAIEMNPWSSRVQKPDHPDWCVIDLDPSKKTTFDQVIEAAKVTKQVLDEAEIDCYCKTSGSTGIHIYIPLAAKYTYEQSKEFARIIVKIVQSELPDFTTIERQVNKRRGKMYLDFLQNRPQATLATTYSVRPKPKASVSTPLYWEELKKGLKIENFTIKNVPKRLEKEGDIFKPVLGKGINMLKALNKLHKQWDAVGGEE